MSRNYHKSILTQTSLSLFRFNRKIGFNTASKSLCIHVQLSCFCAPCRNHQKCATTNLMEKLRLFVRDHLQNKRHARIRLAPTETLTAFDVQCYRIRDRTGSTDTNLVISTDSELVRGARRKIIN